MNNDGTLAWNFASTQQRDGKPLAAPGEVETYDGELVMSKKGLHASEKLLDALYYAPGTLLRRVRMGGEILTGNGKLCASRREILWECEMGLALCLFARECALNAGFVAIGGPTARVVARNTAWESAARVAQAEKWRAWDAARAEQEQRLVAYAQAARAGLFFGND